MATLEEIKNAYPQEERQKDKEQPLSEDQIYTIRRFFSVHRDEKYYEALFEIYYKTGIGQNEIIKYIKSWKNKRNEFPNLDVEKLSKESTFVINPLLDELGGNIVEKLLELNDSNINDKIPSELANLSRSLIEFNSQCFPGVFNLTSTVIKRTHEKFFLACPKCGSKVENLAENWVLVRFDKDPEYRLVCSKCKGIKNGNN